MTGNNGEIPEKIEFTSEMAHACFCIMLKLLGGHIGIKGQSVRDFPPNVKWKAQYDDVNDVWHIVLPVKRKRSIITPRRKIITSN